MQVGDGVADPGVRTEIDFVVEGDEEAVAEGAHGAGQAGVVEPGVGGIEGGEEEGGVDEATEGFAGAAVGLCGRGFAE